jgi:hypothetical protein
VLWRKDGQPPTLLTRECSKNKKIIFGSVLLGLAVGNNVSAETQPQNQKNQIVTPQVVNGDAAPKGKYKFMVALQRDDIKSDNTLRGITAARVCLCPSTS